MIDIEINGIRSDKKKMRLFTEALNFYVTKLFKKDPKIEIELNFINKLDAHGYCIVESSHYPKFFVIELNKNIDEEDQLKALAHESVHCMQYRKNHLQNKKDGVYWKGVWFESMEKNEMYFTAPWELQAYELEETLYNDFKMYYNSLNSKYSLNSK